MLNKLRNICNLFNINKLSYCILRLPASDMPPNEFEVDILIKGVELEHLHDILTEQGFQYSTDGVLSHHHYRKEKLHLDFVVCLFYGRDIEYYIGTGHDVLKNVIFKDNMYFIGNMDEFIMLLYRCLFDKRNFEKYSTRIFQLIDSIGEEKCLKKISNTFNSAK